MFSKITVDNFTTFTHFELDLIENKTDRKAKKMAIIYGENGIGKTCLIKCFEFLKRSYDSLVATEGLSKFLGSLKSGKETFEESLAKMIGNAYDEYRISGYLKKYHLLDSPDDMRLTYELILNQKKYIYSMVFDKKSIVQEKLSFNGKNLFICSKSKMDLPDDVFSNPEIKEKCNSYLQMYFGEKHTFLSCLNFIRRDVSSPFFKKSLSKHLIAFLDYLESLIVVMKEDDMLIGQNAIPNYSSSFLSPISSGTLKEKDMIRLEKTKMALSMFFSSLYSNIQSVEYRIVSNDSGKRTYHLYFVEKKNGRIISIPYELESTGTKKMAALFTSFYELVKNKKTIVIDEIDNGINDILLKTVFDSMCDSINGQLIVTTHNTLLLEHHIKKYIYLFDRDENDNIVSYSLDEFGRKIQPGTDIIGQYLKGLYGGVPQSGAFSMKYISEVLGNNEQEH